MLNFLKKINWRKLLYASFWLLTLVGLGFLMSFIKIKSSEYACNDLQVIIPGEQSFIVREDIDKILKETQGDLIGKTLSAIPIHEIEEDLKANPFVGKAIVSKDISGKITINIKQREAVLRVINQIGNDFYLDNNGLKMPLSAHYAPHVLVANGWISEIYGKSLDSIQTSPLKDLFKLAKYIQQDTLWNSQIEQIYVNRQGEIEMVPRVGNQKITIGNAESLDEKFGKLLVFYKKIIPSVGWDAYRSVDLSFDGQLVCEKNEIIKGN
jgi:cell division protein FtsQ